MGGAGTGQSFSELIGSGYYYLPGGGCTDPAHYDAIVQAHPTADCWCCRISHLPGAIGRVGLPSRLGPVAERDPRPLDLAGEARCASSSSVMNEGPRREYNDDRPGSQSVLGREHRGSR